MKAIIIALFVLVAVASLFQVALCSPDFKGIDSWSSSSNVNTKNIEVKLSEALQGLSAAQKSSSIKSNVDVDDSNGNGYDSPLNNSTAINLSAINKTAINSTAINSTQTNTTALNASFKDEASPEDEGGSGAVSLTGSSSASPQEVGSNSKANFNGFWGMEASQKGTGKNGINSRTFLSGGFEVDKTVKFQDRGY